MKNRRLTNLGLLPIAIIIIAGLVLSSFGTPRAAAQGGPTATPETPEWLAFDAARTALEEELQREIRFVQSWTYDGDANFEKGMTDCRTLKEGETEQLVFFGWRYIITLLNGKAYEVRVSYNREIIVICDQVTVAGASAATPVSNPNLPGAAVAPLGRGTLEIGAQLQVGNTPSQTYAKMRDEAGMKWVKKQVTNSNSGAVSVYLSEATANGMKLLISVLGDPATITTAAAQDAFAAQLAGYARLGVHAIEVWNEANIDREWPRGQIGGASYAQLLAKSYNAIKAANPNTIVISAGPAPTGAAGAQTACSSNASICNDDVWYRELAAAGGGNYMDCVGVHYNEGVVSPTQSSGDPRDNYPTRYYGTNLNRALAPFPGKQACITEIGYLTAEDYGNALPANFTWARDTSIAEHAQWLGQAVDNAQAQGNVRILIVFNFNLTVFTDDPQAGYAMIRKDGSCPACATMKTAISS